MCLRVFWGVLLFVPMHVCQESTTTLHSVLVECQRAERVGRGFLLSLNYNFKKVYRSLTAHTFQSKSFFSAKGHKKLGHFGDFWQTHAARQVHLTSPTLSAAPKPRRPPSPEKVAPPQHGTNATR